MKICLISNLYEPYIIGGAESYVSRLAEKLSERDEVVIITTSPSRTSKTLNKDSISIHCFCPANLYHTYFAKETNAIKKPMWHLLDLWNPHSYMVVSDLLKNEKPDIVHLHNLGGLSLSVLSAIRRWGISHMYTIHDFYLLCPRATLMHRRGDLCEIDNPICNTYSQIKKRIIKSPNAVTAPSQFVLDMHLKLGFFENSHAFKLSLGIAPARITEHRRPKNSISILYVGQVSRHKGVNILIDAFHGIRSDGLTLDIVGKGPDIWEFKRAAEKDKRIIFHGFVEQERLEELYRAADIFVLPSVWFDNSPLVIYEAMSFGLPVLGSRIGGIPELVKDGYNGILFNPGDRVSLRNTLVDLISDESQRKALSENALQSSKIYSMDEHVDRVRAIYQEILNS